MQEKNRRFFKNDEKNFCVEKEILFCYNHGRLVVLTAWFIPCCFCYIKKKIRQAQVACNKGLFCIKHVFYAGNILHKIIDAAAKQVVGYLLQEGIILNNEKVIVAVDAMGGDHAPAEQVKGAVEAVNQSSTVAVKLFGDEEKIKQELSAYTYNKEQVEVIHCPSVVENCDVPTVAIRSKKDSSMVMGLYALKNGEADAFISCGNTGALLVGGQIIVGRIKGIERAGLAFLVPSVKGPVLIMDCGANVDCKPEMLPQFAVMGSIYMKSVLGISNPRVGIINNGEEENKGNQFVKDAFPLLKETNGINFTGSVETRGLTDGEVDVAVCDGFVGNIILKTYEGVAATMLKVVKDAIMSTAKAKIGGMLIKNDLKKAMKQFSIEEYGGAPMLGLRGFVVKPHGSSKAPEIKNAVLQCETAIRQNVTGKIAESL